MLSLCCPKIVDFGCFWRISIARALNCGKSLICDGSVSHSSQNKGLKYAPGQSNADFLIFPTSSAMWRLSTNAQIEAVLFLSLLGQASSTALSNLTFVAQRNSTNSASDRI